MAILQLRVWMCERCDNTETQEDWVDTWNDPTVTYPGWNQEKQLAEGWDHINVNGEYLLLCPKCKQEVHYG